MPYAPEGPIEVVVESYLEDLIPHYLDNRRKDLSEIQTAIAGGDLETVRSLGHQMKGSGGGYGFDDLSDLGARMEAAAKDGDSAAVPALAEELSDYLERLVVSYE